MHVSDLTFCPKYECRILLNLISFIHQSQEHPQSPKHSRQLIYLGADFTEKHKFVFSHLFVCFFFARSYITCGESIIFSLCMCACVCVSLCVCLCVSSLNLICLTIDLCCQCTDQAQTWWRDRVYQNLDPLKKS